MLLCIARSLAHPLHTALSMPRPVAPPRCSCRILLKQSIVHTAYFFKQCIVSLSESKNFGHHPQAMGYVCGNFRVSSICGFCGSTWRRMCFFGVFWHIFRICFENLKTFSKNLSASIFLLLDATFMSNVMFLGLLSPEILLGEKPVTHTATHPAYFAIHEPECCALRNNWQRF